MVGSTGLSSTARSRFLHGLFVIAKPVVGPAERIDDVAVIGSLLDRALDHAHALVEMDALVDPGITER